MSNPFYSRYFKKNLSSMEKDFAEYCNSQSNTIQMEGMEKMGSVLNIDIYSDLFITFFFYQCDCKSMEEVTQDEYIRGLTEFNCNTLHEVKNHIETTREILLNIESPAFRRFYEFLYRFNVTKKSKMIPLEVVEVYFGNLFESFGVTRKLLKYLKEEAKVTGLSKDQWECALDFFINHGSSFPDKYNVAEYYPVLFDNFYTWYISK